MTIIRTYTTIEQSRKLAEILSPESADTLHCIDFDGDLLYTVPKQYSGSFRYQPELTIPCWSLSALLGVLPPYLYEWEKGIDFNLYPSVAKKRWWCAGYISQDLSPENKDKFTLITHADNPIDACYEMIIKLHELKMM